MIVFNSKLRNSIALKNWICAQLYGIWNFFLLFFGGGGREGYTVQTWSKNPIMAPFSVYLSPDMSADASADALAIINIS